MGTKTSHAGMLMGVFLLIAAPVGRVRRLPDRIGLIFLGRLRVLDYRVYRAPCSFGIPGRAKAEVRRVA